MHKRREWQKDTLHFPLLMLLTVSLSLFSCAPAPRRVVSPPATDTVVASWYGPKFHGRPTASGEIYNMYDFTCAHKRFPFGTKLHVTNPRNNKSVIVRVNDRGPFVSGRDLDLSYAAARQIGLIKQGVGKVRIQYRGRDTRYIKRIEYSPSSLTGPFTIQVGSFREQFNAARLVKGLKIKYRDVYMNKANIKGKIYYRVRIGSFSSRDSAHSYAKALAEEGYKTFITGKD
jgi:rare lipoprotein A